MNLLEEARIKINQIDQQVAKLFEERMNVVNDVLAYKRENNLPIFDAAREKDVILRNSTFIQNSVYIPYYQHFLQDLMDVSKQYQLSLLNSNKVAYQGCKGAFSHIALMKLFPDYNAISFSTFQEVFEAVSNREVSYGIIPMENSYTGEIGEVLDLLKKYDCYITDCYNLEVTQNLVGIPGTKINEIKQIYSHPQAIQQSLRYLKPFDVELIPFANTALAAKYIQEEQNPTKAAIAAKETAELYQLEILEEKINTSSDNMTRFIIIEKELKKDVDHFCLLFSLKHEMGQLASVLDCIREFGFNLINIRSRATHETAWEYFFFLELEGSYHSENTEKLIASIEPLTKFFKVVGTY